MKEIASVHNPAVLALRELQKPRARREQGLFLCESAKMVREALALSLCRTLIVQRGREEDYAREIDAAQAQGAQALLVAPPVMQALSEAKTPQGIAATVAIRPEPQALSGSRIVALDGVQDPGNLGTIIRIADWFGIRRIFCSPETADVWNPKVIQATMGSIARVSVEYTPLVSLMDSLPEGFPVYGTLLDGDDITKADTHNHGIIVMGNEGNGISPAIRERVTHKLLIPNYPAGSPTADSLNVAIATSITCFAIRQRPL